MKEIAIFAAASETFSQKNTNCSIEESIERFTELVHLAKENHLKIRGYVSCVMGCPYENHVDIQLVDRVSKSLLDLGCYEISLGDTIGAATIQKTHSLL